jgi:predicted porin
MMAKKGPDRGVVSSTAAKVRFYGHVNRAVRFASTPSRSDFQSVDNGESNSRFGLVADVQLNKSVSGTAQLELGWNGLGRADFEAVSDPKRDGIQMRHSVISLTHKDMGTLSLGHSGIAGSGAAYFSSFAGTGLAFGVGGPANDGITATRGDEKGVKRIGAPFGLFAHRRGRILYKTPSLMGISVDVSYNEGRDWSVGGSLSGLPGVKAVGVLFGAGYRDWGNGTTTTAVSGGVQHNASGLSVNGWWAQAKATGKANHTGWMADVSWTGSVIKAGATSLTASYGVWEKGLGNTARYFVAVNQNITAAATQFYAGVAYDTGETAETEADAGDTTCDTDADSQASCSVGRDGVFVLIAGARIRF